MDRSKNTNTQIDLIYLWCDGQDPKFVEAKKSLLTDGMDDDCVGDVRYVDNEELRYSLRSVQAHMPWVNHIYIVTNNQCPQWLLDHPKITIVDHKDIIPRELLPTFNSVTIEMYLDRIPNLSEKFLYLNDDMFVNSNLEPSDFFKGNHPIVRFSRKFKKVSTIEEARRYLDAENPAFGKTLVRAWLALCEKYGVKYTFYTPTHSIDAFTKTLFRQVLDRYPELLKVNSSKLRTGQEIQRVLFQYEMAFKLGCPYLVHRRVTFLRHLMSLFSMKLPYSVYASNVKKAHRRIGRYKPQTFCLNNISVNEKEALKKFLEQKYPNPAPWEKNEYVGY